MICLEPMRMAGCNRPLGCPWNSAFGVLERWAIEIWSSLLSRSAIKNYFPRLIQEPYCLLDLKQFLNSQSLVSLIVLSNELETVTFLTSLGDLLDKLKPTLLD